MDYGTAVGWGVVVAGVLAALFGLNWLALKLEANGLSHYLGNSSKEGRSGGGGGGGFGALQQVVEPRSAHVFHVHDASERLREDDAGGGSGGPDPEAAG